MFGDDNDDFQKKLEVQVQASKQQQTIFEDIT